MLKLLPYVIKHKLSYRWGWPKVLPINVTISVTFNCPSRCLTCNVTSRKAKELSVDEYRKIFRSLGHDPFWVTISGGEPFLRPDLPEIVDAIVEESRPQIINIPTSGTTHKHIFKFLPRMLEATKGMQFTVNFSLDEIGERHDQIRRTPHNWVKTLESIRFAKSLKKDFPHLVVGIHSVISIFNVKRFPEIYEDLQALAPDSYITEVAEERAELLTMGSGITPPPKDYAEAVDFLIARMKAGHQSGFASVVEAFRLEYYQLVKRILSERRQVIPCYAGLTSCHIAADGDLWGCCVRAEPVGNLREVDYDFGRLWQGVAARGFRRSVKNLECQCPLANASYTNMLMDTGSVLRVGRTLLVSGAARVGGLMGGAEPGSTARRTTGASQPPRP
jgi:MoaA/NifB/PqqE/SkfB family radical SAM enzyme